MARRGSLGICLLAFLALPFPGFASTQAGVAGTVLGEDRQPVSGARVELVPVLSAFEGALRHPEDPAGPPPAAVAETDGAGRFSLRAPGSGLFKIIVRKAGTVPTQLAPLAWTGPVEPPPAVLPPDAGAALRLLDAAGRPLAGVWVAASGRDTGGDWRPAPRFGRTDAQGALALPRLAGEELELSVFVPQRAELVRGKFQGGTIQVPAGGEVWQSLKVTSRGGEPIGGAVVRLGNHAWPFGRTDAQGRLRLPIPAEGTTPLLILAEDGRQALVQTAARPGQPEQAVLLADPVALSGRIVEGAGRFPAPSSGYPRTLAPSFARTARAASGSSFPRAAAARSRPPPRATCPKGENPRAAARERPRSDPRPGAGGRAARQRRRLRRPAAPRRRGRRRRRSALGERPFDPADPVADRAVADAQGRFELRYLRPEESYEVRATRAGAFPSMQRAVASDPSTPPRGITLVLSPARAVLGKIQDAEGRPVAGAEVLVRPALRPDSPARFSTPPGEPTAPAEAATVQSDGQEIFRIPKCLAAEVELAVRKRGYAALSLRALRISAGGTGPVNLGIVTLRPSARLAGRVVDGRNQAIPGAELFVLAQPLGPNEVERLIKGRKPEAASAADGRFAIDGLGRGTPVHLVVRAAGFQTARAQGVRPPTERPLLIRLDPGAALQGRVVDEDGDPVAGARIELRWQALLPEDPE